MPAFASPAGTRSTLVPRQWLAITCAVLSVSQELAPLWPVVGRLPSPGSPPCPVTAGNKLLLLQNSSKTPPPPPLPLHKLPAMALDTRSSPVKLPDMFDTDVTERASGRRHLVDSCTQDGWGSTPSFFWARWTAICGASRHDVPLRWPRVSLRVVVRLFHHTRDDPPPAKVAGGRMVKSAPARQA